MNLRNRGLPLPIFSSSEGNSRMTPSLHTSTVQAGPSSLNMGSSNSLGSVSINSQSSHTYTTSPPIQSTYSFPYGAQSTHAPVQSAPGTNMSNYSALSTNLSNQSVQNTFPQSNSALSTNLSNQSVQNTFPQSISALSTSYPYHCAPSAMNIPQSVLNTQNKASIDMTYDQTVIHQKLYHAAKHISTHLVTPWILIR